MPFGSFITDLFWEAIIYGDNLCTLDIIFVMYFSFLCYLSWNIGLGLHFWFPYTLLLFNSNLGFCSSLSLNFLNIWLHGLLISMNFSLDSITLLSCFSYVASQTSFCSYSTESSRFLEVLFHPLLHISSLPMTSISVYNWSICIEVTFAVSFSLRVLQINCECFIVIST